MSMKNSNDTIGNRTRELLACSAIPQPTAPTRAPVIHLKIICTLKRGVTPASEISEQINYPDVIRKETTTSVSSPFQVADSVPHSEPNKGSPHLSVLFVS